MLWASFFQGAVLRAFGRLSVLFLRHLPAALLVGVRRWLCRFFLLPLRFLGISLGMVSGLVCGF